MRGIRRANIGSVGCNGIDPTNVGLDWREMMMPTTRILNDSERTKESHALNLKKPTSIERKYG